MHLYILRLSRLRQPPIYFVIRLVSILCRAITTVSMSCGSVVREPDLRSTGRGFESRPPRAAECNPGKLLTHMCLCHQAV